MSIELNGYPPQGRRFESQQQSQEMTASLMPAEEPAGGSNPPSRWLAWQQVIGGFLVIFNAQQVTRSPTLSRRVTDFNLGD